MTDEQELTVKDARRILRGTLVFGNERQIKAVRLIELAELIADQWFECPECEGAGDRELAEGEWFACPMCKGAGKALFSSEDIDAMDADEIALLEKLREKAEAASRI